MRVFFTGVHIMLPALLAPMILGSEVLLKNHCGDCHHENNADDLFDLSELTSENNDNQLQVIGHSLDRVVANEMPPREHAILSNQEKRNLIRFLESLAHKAEKKLGEHSPLLCGVSTIGSSKTAYAMHLGLKMLAHMNQLPIFSVIHYTRVLIHTEKPLDLATTIWNNIFRPLEKY